MYKIRYLGRIFYITGAPSIQKIIAPYARPWFESKSCNFISVLNVKLRGRGEHGG